MGTFVALLRGVNVGGARRLPMADLRRALEALGVSGVRTYLQSGNAVFVAGENGPALLSRALHDRLADDLDLDVDVLVLSAEELRRIVRANPFLGEAGIDEDRLHATFLFAPVTPADLGGLELPAAEGERAAFGEQVVFLYLPHGYGRTRLNNGFFEKALAVPATTRNWRTVLALTRLAGAP